MKILPAEVVHNFHLPPHLKLQRLLRLLRQSQNRFAAPFSGTSHMSDGGFKPTRQFHNNLCRQEKRDVGEYLVIPVFRQTVFHKIPGTLFILYTAIRLSANPFPRFLLPLITGTCTLNKNSHAKAAFQTICCVIF